MPSASLLNPPYRRASINRSTAPSLVATLSIILLGSTSLARAQTELLPTLLVTSATGVPTPLNQVASSITVITAEDIERDQRRTAVDALQTVPGLNVVQSGGPGSQTSVFMRGTNSGHTKVIIDGIDVSNPSTPNRIFDLGQLPAYDIERIEVLRGPLSALY